MRGIQISVVIPTYREAENLPLITRQVSDALATAGYTHEIIIADDISGDDTPAVCDTLAETLPLRLLSRAENRGLSAAVIDGIHIAAGEVIIVMDADLSHPPQKAPELARLLLQGEADFVVGSRYVKGGGLGDDWPWWRWLNSLAATLPARALTPLADPMSGFFAIRRADVPAREKLSPIGYKIGMELLVKAGFAKQRVREVPIHFRNRLYGTSKMTLREQLNYLRHLRRLYHYRWPKRMEVLQFLTVGTCGLALDLAVYFLLLFAGAPHLIARAAAYWPAVTFNWFANRGMTFKHRPPRPRLAQWLQYSVGSVIGFCISWGVYALLTQFFAFFNDWRLLAFFAGVVAGTVANFLISDKLVFRGGH